MIASSGTFYGIGVGPGDPDLITLKSVKILRRVDIVYAAASTKNKHSMAVSIAGQFIPEDTPVKMLSFPMTKDKSVTQKAWEENALTVIKDLEQGKDGAFITVGDPTTYSTYGYILKHVQRLAPHLRVKTIPGITSYHAAAARLNITLVQGEESLLVTSGVEGGNRLRKLFVKPENVVFLKAYHKVKDIIGVLEETGRFKNCVGVKKCGLPGEEIIHNIKDFNNMPPDYWTLIIAQQRNEVQSVKRFIDDIVEIAHEAI
jgi:precorrin-2/cobalt-factor-2 C20-methyltransferase